MKMWVSVLGLLMALVSAGPTASDVSYTTGGVFKTGQSLSADITAHERVQAALEHRSALGAAGTPLTIHAVSFEAYVAGVCDAECGALQTPNGFTDSQACLIVAEYVHEHPERLQEPAALLVKDAIREAYPMNLGTSNYFFTGEKLKEVHDGL